MMIVVGIVYATPMHLATKLKRYGDCGSLFLSLMYLLC